MKEWTIMVYMAGDNNLSEDMITGLKGMTGLLGNKDINLIALYDSNYPPVPVRVYEFSKNPGAQKPRKPDLSYFESPLSPVPRNTNPQTESYWIQSFLPRVMKKFPARKYAVILSGHSDGIIGKTLLRDENPNISLNLQQLRGILRQSRPMGSNGKRKNFDLLGFDGCLMGMVEVGYELRDVANVIVASEGNIPTAGWPYEEVLADLIKNPKSNEREFARSIVDRYARYNVDYSVSGRSIDISASDLKSVQKLTDAIHTFAGHLLKSLEILPAKDEENPGAINKKIIREHFIDCILLAHYRSQVYMHNQGVDLMDFVANMIGQSMKRLVEHDHLSKGAKNDVPKKIFDATKLLFKDYLAIKRIMFEDKRPYIISNCSVGAQYQFSKGAAIFFPWTSLALEMIAGRYADLKFNDDPRWLKLLNKRLDLTLRTQNVSKVNKTNSDLKLPTVSQFNAPALTISTYIDLAHREHGGKEHGGKEHGGKEHGGKEHGGKGGMESFYNYFSQFQNYDPEFLGKNC